MASRGRSRDSLEEVRATRRRGFHGASEFRYATGPGMLTATSSLSRRFHQTDDATVDYVDLSVDASREAEALDWLDEAERARLRRFHYPRPRRQFTLCRAALRSLLCGKLGCRNEDLSFGASKFGKPFARVGGVAASAVFNVSHSGRHGLIAFAQEGRIGVDVEDRTAERDLDGYTRILFAPVERNALETASGSRKVDLFYSLWTMKEALIKAVGAGLSLDTAEFEIPPAMVRGARSGAFRFSDTPSVTWRLRNIGDTRFAAAIAHERVDRVRVEAGR